ncbi:MAG TPA: TonB-dependent receptor [Casimicrobiaceae bacterium]|nr:TonB-dependent receptor [Casimicrobiaceae bacterium]
MVDSWHRRAAALLGVAAIAASRLTHSQTPEAPALLDPVTVTATRSPQRLTEIIADVTVIGPDEIARAGAQGLADLLQRQPGVQIATTGGPGTTTSVFLRGANANQTLLLVDGLRVGSSSSGTAPFEAIPLSEIDHIEILRGPAASLYGADAIGGVVQVFTRSAGKGFAANASAGYGTYNTSQFSAGASGSAESWRIALQGGYQQSSGFNAIWNPANFSYNPDRDGYTNGNGSGSLTYRFAPEQQLSLQAFYSRLNAQFDASPDFDDRTITTVQSYAVASSNRLASFWKSTLEAGTSSDDSNSQTAFGPSQFKTVQRQYLWQNDLSLPLGALSLALSRREERLNTDAGFPVTARNTNAVIGVYQLREGANALQANLRHDQSSQYGGQTSGAIEYAYSLSSNLRASMSYGTGFKAPTFNDLYFPGFSNPNLVPETAHNLEGALRYSDAMLNAGVVAYRNRVKDLIVFSCDADFNCAPQNIASATLEGITLELQALYGDTNIKGSLDFARPYDDATGNLLPRRARYYGSLQVTQSLGALQLGVQVIASSARYEDPANTRRMGGYAVVNFNAEYAVAPQWALFAIVGNAFDKNYELAADYNTPGSNVFAGVRYRY